MTLFASMFGCADDLDPKSLITRPRIVGLEANVVGDPGRATAAPTEQLDVTLNLVEPLAASFSRWRFIACVPVSNVFNAPRCVDGVSVECPGCEDGTSTMPSDPSMRFTIPSAEDLGYEDEDVEDADSILLVGVVCAGGDAASIDQLRAITTGEATTVSPCAKEENDGEFVATEIPIQVGFTTNQNPAFTNAIFGGGEWTYEVSDNASDSGCAGEMGIPRRLAGGPPVSLAVNVDPDSFEDFEIASGRPDAGKTDTETLLVSWHVTGGDLDQSFTFLDTPTDSEALNVWLPPSTAPSDGMLVRFTIVLRDRDEQGAGRGGTHWIERAVCICPTSGCM